MSSHSPLTRERFRFQSQALHDENALRVVRFTGTEGLSTLYRFEIVLATQQVALPLERMLAEPARLVILREDGRHATFSGLPTHIQQTTRYNDWTFYKLTLQPAFWKFTQIVQNSFHVDKTVREIIESSLDSIDYFDLSLEFRLLGNYTRQEFSMQHNESIYDFLAWKMERDGIYYFFDEQDTREHLVFADAPTAHAPLETTPELYYSPTSGLEATHKDEVISTFSLNVSPLPRRVVLRDYDCNRPNAPVVVDAEVSPHGLGTVYCYGEGFTTEAEGKRLARIRAQALACRGRVFSGEGSVPTLRPGRNFTLKDHYDESFNRDYMLVSVTHEGSQEAWLSQAVGVPIERENDRLFYRNSFTCIPADVQFRPERKTERTKVSGMLTAFVDASSSSGKPEIDAQGRYKVVFPQDDSGRNRGKASCWLRRMQPHVGKGHGTVFPLGPGVEVMVAFMDGNPDRPFIAGAVANAETGTMESPASNELTGLRTDGGNGLLFHNKGKKQGLQLATGSGASGLYMGSGSLDTALQFTDILTQSSGTLQSSFSGMASSYISGFEGELSANAGIYNSIAQIFFPAITGVTSALASITNTAAKSEGDSTVLDIAANAFSDINALVKAVATFKNLFLQKAKLGITGNVKYGVDISTTHEKSMSSVYVRNYPKAQLLAEFMITTTASIAARFVAVAGNVVNTGLDISKDVTNQEVQINKEWGKANAAANNVVDNVGALIAEVVSMIALYKKSHGLNPLDFGGVHISSADKNVLISSKTESRMVSDGDIVLRAAKGELRYSAANSHKDLAGEIKALKFGKGKDTHLLMTADNTYSGSFKEARILAGKNLILGANDNIVISTTKAGLTTLDKDADLTNAALQISEDGDVKHGEITLQPTEVKIASRNEDKAATVDLKPDEVAITAEDGDKGSLSIKKNKIEARAKDLGLHLDSELDAFEVFKKNENTGLGLDFREKEALITADNGITLTTTKDCKLDTDTTTISAKSNIDLDSDSVTIGKQSKLILTSSEWTANCKGTLKLHGNMVQIN